MVLKNVTSVANMVGKSQLRGSTVAHYVGNDQDSSLQADICPWLVNSAAGAVMDEEHSDANTAMSPIANIRQPGRAAGTSA